MAIAARKHKAPHKTHRMNPKSLSNLNGHRIQPGEHLNPNGRPTKELSITEALREVSKWTVNTKVDLGSMTFAQKAAYVHWKHATDGDLGTYEFITNRLEGKPKESVDVTTKGEGIGDGHKDIPEQCYTDALVILARSGVSPN